MPIISTITVTALAVAGALTGNIIEKEPYHFYDPLGYVEYNILNASNNFSYNDNVRNIINTDNISIDSYGYSVDAYIGCLAKCGKISFR